MTRWNGFNFLPRALFSPSGRTTPVVLFLLLLITTARTNGAGQTSDTSPQGILFVGDSGTVQVQGNPVANGGTVFSGSEINTNRRSATIEVPNEGRVALCPDSSATIVLTRNSIEVTLSKGQASVTASGPVNGRLTSKDGQVLDAKSLGVNGSVSLPCAKDDRVGVGPEAVEQEPPNLLSWILGDPSTLRAALIATAVIMGTPGQGRGNVGQVRP